MNRVQPKTPSEWTLNGERNSDSIVGHHANAWVAGESRAHRLLMD
jgi:hypothetical protein